MAVYLSGSDTPTRYVQAMISVLDLSLTAGQYNSYIAAARLVASAKKAPLDICKLHQTMFSGEKVAGTFRSCLVIDGWGKVKDLPRASDVPKLVFSFKRAYSYALKPDLNLEQADQLGWKAWMVAAGGRCLHPFVIGNTRLFCLIENHIRQAQALPWTFEIRPQEQFRTFRNMYRNQNQEFYAES